MSTLFGDVHHFDLERTAYVGYLSRHVRESRIFVDSRIEVPLPPDTPAPVVLRRGLLDAEPTAMLAMIAPAIWPARIWPRARPRRPCGSPSI